VLLFLEHQKKQESRNKFQIPNSKKNHRKQKTANRKQKITLNPKQQTPNPKQQTTNNKQQTLLSIRHPLAQSAGIFTTNNTNMMNTIKARAASRLPGQVAEQLLELGFSISFEQEENFEYLSATSAHTKDGKLFFLAFDPVATNAFLFFNTLQILKSSGACCHIIVEGPGERQLILNILEMQEINGVEVWCVDRLRDYPLQVI
jgi:hypothetical protein